MTVIMKDGHPMMRMEYASWDKEELISEKKRESICLNGMDHDIEISAQSCNCTVDDYECDFCYEMKLIDGRPSCVFTCFYDNEEIKKLPTKGNGDCLGNTEYYGTKLVGFRKIPGDKCLNELKNVSALILCRFPTPNQTLTRWITKPVTTKSTTTAKFTDNEVIDPPTGYSTWDIVLIVTSAVAFVLIVLCVFFARKKIQVAYKPLEVANENQTNAMDENITLDVIEDEVVERNVNLDEE